MTEGEIGTWSHCGSRKPHPAHRHTIVLNEGPYPDILCLGTPDAEEVARTTEEIRRICCVNEEGEREFDRWLANYEQQIRNQIATEVVAAIDGDVMTLSVETAPIAARVARRTRALALRAVRGTPRQETDHE